MEVSLDTLNFAYVYVLVLLYWKANREKLDSMSKVFLFPRCLAFISRRRVVRSTTELFIPTNLKGGQNLQWLNELCSMQIVHHTLIYLLRLATPFSLGSLPSASVGPSVAKGKIPGAHADILLYYY